MNNFDILIQQIGWDSEGKAKSVVYLATATNEDFPGVSIPVSGDILLTDEVETTEEIRDYIQDQLQGNEALNLHVRQVLSDNYARSHLSIEETREAALKSTLDRVQFEFMVENLGLTLDQIKQAVEEADGLSDDERLLARVLIRSGSNFQRTHPFMQLLVPLTNLTQEQLDDAWVEGTKVNW